MMLRIASRCLSPGGSRGRLSVLIFHRVATEPDHLLPDEIDARQFDRILGWVGRWFQVVPLDGALQQLTAGTLAPRAAAITFDDGYLDNHAVALPLLRRHGMPATFFIATDFLDGGMMFNDAIIASIRDTRRATLDLVPLGLGVLPVSTIEQRQDALYRVIAAVKYLDPAERHRAVQILHQAAGTAPAGDPMMKPRHLADLLSAGMSVGAHTCSHPILSRLPDPLALREIRDSKHRLESELGVEVPLFAYPNGKPGTDYTAAHAAMVRACGFRGAVSTAPGAASHGDDVFQMPRFSPWDRTRLRFGLRMLLNLRTRVDSAS
jgi:peptidoglycan/xylan/chitin deacetylase (PgdA/CDA1 family)